MSAEIVVDPAPALGAETVVSITDDVGRPSAGVTVRVVHRPGLDGSREVAVGITDSLGRVRWTPDESGVAMVMAKDAQLPIDVAWTAPPTSTAVLLGLLLCAAVGWIGWGLGRARPVAPRTR